MPRAVAVGLPEPAPADRCQPDAAGWIPSTTSFFSWRRHRTACGCNDAVIKLGRWVKSRRWTPLYRNDYGECTITLPGEVDGHRVRVGCDVVAIEDIQDSLAAFGDRYLRKVFTASEINDCQGHNRVHRLAARFAAKEAVIKAFAEPDMPFPLREIEVTMDGPLPLLRLSGAVAERAQHQGWLRSSLSLSHADCHAMAVVLVVCSPARSD